MSKQLVVPPSIKQQLQQWYPQEMIDDVPVLKDSIYGFIFGLFRQRAVTLNGTVHLTRHAPELDTTPGTVLLGHELYHVQQQRDLGWRGFLFRYLKGWRPSHITQGWRHPLERPAYDRGEEIRQTLGTS